MKKLIIIICVFFLFSFRTQQQKMITLNLTVEEVQMIYDALGELPAKKVEALRMKIFIETQRQLADTIKKK